MKIKVIDTQQELTELKEISKNNRFLLLPIFDDVSHPILQSPILVLAKPLTIDELYVIGIDHHECLKTSFDFSIFNKPFVYNKKYFNLEGSLDIDSCYYINKDEYTINLFKSQENWKIYPIYKLVDKIKDDIKSLSEYCLNFKDEDRKDYRFLNEITIPSLVNIEKNGMKVDEELFKNNFNSAEVNIKDGFIYTQYNYLTTTGRPSNRYGGVNYSALNKTDESRKCFISRFEGGNLIMMDYDSYHMRLIANLLKYELPDESIHTHFAKQYFNTDDITEELYNESKKISFRLLYGGIIDEYKDVEFFKGVQSLTNSLWDIQQREGCIRSVVSQIPIVADNKLKLFNYTIQNYETEQNMLVLRKILKETKSYKSIPILYTYDSILFDVHPDEQDEYINVSKNIMQLDGEFPVKVSVGKNYHEIEKI